MVLYQILLNTDCILRLRGGRTLRVSGPQWSRHLHLLAPQVQCR